MKSFVRELPEKKPYVAPVLVVHGDLRTLTQAGSTGTGESGNCQGKGNASCAFKT